MSQFPSYRPAVMGRHGMVSSAHYLASMAGQRVMMDGGNAVDAVVATAATLNVVEPYMSGLGGDGLMSITLLGAREPVILDYTGSAPLEASMETMQLADMQSGPRAMLVPGAAGGWLTALARYGTMPASRVFADAIDLAEHGAPVSHRNVEFISGAARSISGSEHATHTFLPGGEPPRAGGLLRQPNLARTLRRLAEGGSAEFYGGSLGREVVAAVRAAGGVLSDADLIDFTVRWQHPLSIEFRGYQVFAPPPPCAGFQFLQTIRMLEDDDLTALGHNSVDYLHLLLEAIKLAASDRIEYTCRTDIDHTELLAADYLQARRRLIDPERAALGPGERFDSPETKNPAVVNAGPARRNGEHTTHFAAADASGMAVAVTQSLGNPFGCGFMAGETGVMMNNFLNWIDLDPESPNALAPGKPMENCMAPPQVYRDGHFLFSIGTPGSWGIPQSQSQALLNVMAFGMTVQQAIEAPRVKLQAGYHALAEGRIPVDVTDALNARGHAIERVADLTWLVGGMHGVYRDPETGVLMGGADPRRDGYAVGW
ncbi:MAG TPA: gamma-glutamyltransferase family protein [Thermomicrobiales bacterium]|nr:gamma-glutamyltransferase family protein [Thermomicrobiales bacterium]